SREYLRRHRSSTRFTIRTDNASASIVSDWSVTLRDVAFPALDLADVRPVQAGLVGRPSCLPSLHLAKCPHFGPSLLLYGLHQQQFGGWSVFNHTGITSRRLRMYRR